MRVPSLLTRIDDIGAVAAGDCEQPERLQVQRSPACRLGDGRPMAVVVAPPTRVEAKRLGLRQAFELFGRPTILVVRVRLLVKKYQRIVRNATLGQEVREVSHLGEKSIRDDHSEESHRLTSSFTRERSRRTRIYSSKTKLRTYQAPRHFGIKIGA